MLICENPDVLLDSDSDATPTTTDTLSDRNTLFLSGRLCSVAQPRTSVLLLLLFAVVPSSSCAHTLGTDENQWLCVCVCVCQFMCTNICVCVFFCGCGVLCVYVYACRCVCVCVDVFVDVMVLANALLLFL
jgi:hypothetical protein